MLATLDVLTCWRVIIYAFAFSRCFYPKGLTVHSGYTIFFFIGICVPWELNPQPFALLTRNALSLSHRNHWYTGDKHKRNNNNSKRTITLYKTVRQSFACFIHAEVDAGKRVQHPLKIVIYTALIWSGHVTQSESDKKNYKGPLCQKVCHPLHRAGDN